MSNDVFARGERQAFIQGQEVGRENATRLIQTLVASVVQKAEKDGDLPRFKAASEIVDILFNYNWGLDGGKPPMPPRDGDIT